MDFVLNSAVYSSDFACFQKKLLSFWIKIFNKSLLCLSFLSYCSFITLAQNTISRPQHHFWENVGEEASSEFPRASVSKRG